MEAQVLSRPPRLRFAALPAAVVAPVLALLLLATPAGAAESGFTRDLTPPAPIASAAKAKPVNNVQRIVALADEYPRLDGSERKAADRLLQRPSDGASDPGGNGWKVAEASNSPLCSAHFCVHWVDSTDDAPALTDTNGNGIPDYVEEVSGVAENAFSVENGQLGWRTPKSDGIRGGGQGMTDIYLAQLGGTGVYGYTSPDPGQAQSHSLSAYLVIDNNFAPNEYRGYASPSLPLDVTMAHEYNHVLHFTYDALEDTWMFESTAVWMEDQVYNNINDYLQYLPRWATLTGQPITQFQGQTAVDTGTSIKVYGSAVWNHWLANRYGRDVVRTAWERSVAAKSFAPAAYSAGIRARGGSSFFDDFSRFAAATAEWRSPGSGFPEGASYPDVTRAGDLTVDGAGGTAKLDHTAYALADVKGATNERIKLAVSVPKGTAGSIALIGKTDGKPVVRIRELPKGGIGILTLSDPGQYDRLTAALINGDTQQSGFNMQTGDYEFTKDGQPFQAVVSSDFTAPKIAKAASTSAGIKVTFSEPVREVSVKTLRLLGPSGKKVRARVKFKPGARTALLLPSASVLPPGLYHVAALDGITDLALNALKPAESSAFRVG
jgi:hypothetical protein